MDAGTLIGGRSPPPATTRPTPRPETSGRGPAIDGGGDTTQDRVLDLYAPEVVLDRVTVRGGRAGASGTGGGPGGGIRSGSTTSLVLVRSTVEDNVAHADGTCVRESSTSCRPDLISGGGGIASSGDLTIIGSTIVGNRAMNKAPVTCQTVFYVLCTATYAGGVLAAGGTLDVIDSTFEDNDHLHSSSGSYAGNPPGGEAIYAVAHASATVRASTFVEPTPTTDDIVRGVTPRGSILVSSACGTPIVGADHNLVSPCGAAGSGLDGLGALGANDGATASRVPAPTSAAVDAIPAGIAELCDGSIPKDQRGEPRPAGAACDVGAVERQPADP